MATEWSLHAFFNPRNSLNAAELIAREQNATKGPNKDVYQAYRLLFTAHLASAGMVRIKRDFEHLRPSWQFRACRLSNGYRNSFCNHLLVHSLNNIQVFHVLHTVLVLSSILRYLLISLKFWRIRFRLSAEPKRKTKLTHVWQRGNTKEVWINHWPTSVDDVRNDLYALSTQSIDASVEDEQHPYRDKSKTLGDVTADSCISID